MDTIWDYLSTVALPGLETLRFSRLSKVAKVVLTIPHSNAAEERVFSRSKEMIGGSCSWKEL